MVLVLQEIAADPEQRATARVAAAKAVLTAKQAHRENVNASEKAAAALKALLAPAGDDSEPQAPSADAPVFPSAKLTEGPVMPSAAILQGCRGTPPPVEPAGPES